MTRGGLLLVVAALTLAACGGRDPGPASPRDTAPPASASPDTPGEPRADARGVITYPDYQVVVARGGDTLGAIADRIGVPVAEIASYNGLPSDWRPREGDTLVIPPERRVAPLASATPARPRPTAPATPAEPAPGTEVEPGTGTPGWSPDLVSDAIERADPEPDASTPVSPLSEPGAPPGTTPPGTDPSPTAPPETTAGVEPLSHTVEPGETIYSISRLYGVPVTAIAAWNGLGRDYTLRPGQVIKVPLGTPAAAPPGQAAPPAPPPSSGDPLPANPPRAEIPASPQLDRFRSDSPDAPPLLVPVDGPILRPYAPSGPARNDGIDISAAPGTTVRAAEDGEVALISNSLGSLGKIILIRHAGGLTTVYGRVDGVTVRKGEMVTRGQTIGVVADTSPPSLHFEVRRGADSVDPAGYL